MKQKTTKGIVEDGPGEFDSGTIADVGGLVDRWSS